MSDTLRLAAVFSDRMVLCRRKEIRVFGTAENGRTVAAELAGHTGQATAAEGRFTLPLPPMEAGGPYELTVTDGQTTLRFYDVYVGDVYLAGGQSNMELELQNVKDGPELVARADNPLIRFYNVLKTPWLDEKALAAERETRWKALAPGACADVSAVAYHFAARLQPEIGVAVGVIDCYWGGTSVTCWMDEPALLETAAGQYYWTDYAMRVGDQTEAQYQREDERFHTRLAEWDRQVAAMREANPALSQLEIEAAIGPCPWNPPAGHQSPFRPAGLEGTMLSRVAPYTLTGALYYQGEEDAHRAALYQPLLTALIGFWRKRFCDDRLPFLFAQLPMFGERGDAPVWAELRWAQERTYESVRHTGMAVLIDLGERDNIHPVDKAPVGERLCLQALKAVYGRDADADGPRAVCKRTDGNALTVALDRPIHCTGDAPALLEIAGEDRQFVPANAALAENGRALRLTAEGIERPLYARYAWVNYGVVNLFGENGLPLAPFILS